MLKRKSWTKIGLLLLLVVIVSACSKEKPEAVPLEGGEEQRVDVRELSNAPAALRVYGHVEAMDDSTFRTYIANNVIRKYPHITLEFSSGGRDNLAKVLASGELPDIILAGSDNYMALQDAGLPYDLTPMIKTFGIDTSLIVPEVMETVRTLGEGKLTSLPFSRNGSALYYNKDIFDKFGIPYPTNGMTYDQVIDLARRLTQSRDGIQYIGWEPGFPDANASPFAEPFVDMKTGKALVDTPAYNKVFTMMKQGFDIPGFIGPKDLFRYTPKYFVTDHVLAMYVDWYNKMMTQLIAAEEGGKAPNWDIVTVPNFPEFANVGRHQSVQFLMITEQSKFKEQALQVLETTISRESQLLQSRNGRIAILSDPEVQKQFGADVKAYQGKQMDNLFKFRPVQAAARTIYDDDMREVIRNVAKEIAINGKDVNTALREAQEQADKRLAELMK